MLLETGQGKHSAHGAPAQPKGHLPCISSQAYNSLIFGRMWASCFRLSVWACFFTDRDPLQPNTIPNSGSCFAHCHVYTCETTKHLARLHHKQGPEPLEATAVWQ